MKKRNATTHAHRATGALDSPPVRGASIAKMAPASGSKPPGFKARFSHWFSLGCDTVATQRAGSGYSPPSWLECLVEGFNVFYQMSSSALPGQVWSDPSCIMIIYTLTKSTSLKQSERRGTITLPCIHICIWSQRLGSHSVRVKENKIPFSMM